MLNNRHNTTKLQNTILIENGNCRFIYYRQYNKFYCVNIGGNFNTNIAKIGNFNKKSLILNKENIQKRNPS